MIWLCIIITVLLLLEFQHVDEVYACGASTSHNRNMHACTLTSFFSVNCSENFFYCLLSGCAPLGTHTPATYSYFASAARLASIPGRVFAFITVRRTTGPGTSCLRMRQIFIVYLWSAKIFNKSIMEICTQKMHRVSTQKMHIGSCFTKAWGVASCAAAQLQ